MADSMFFPEKWEDFLLDHEFEDSQEIYTNGSMLIPSFRVEQMMEHYGSTKPGRWVCLEPEIGYYACSECDHRILRAKCNYCPGCGARMEELPTEVTPDE